MTTIATTFQPVDHDGRLERRLGRVSWGPIMMGVVIAIGLQFIFTVLGLAVGVTAADSDSDTPGEVRTIGVLAGVWWLVSGTLSLAVGGYVYGRLSGLARSLPLKLESVVLWGVVALFGFVVLWSGSGMLAQSISPTGSMSLTSMRSDRSSSLSAHTGESFNEAGADESVLSAGQATDKAVRQATRTAAWWSLIGLMAGVAACMGGACAAVPAEMNHRTR